MYHITVGICQNLKFHMAGTFDIMFQIHGIITEALFCFCLCDPEILFKILFGSGKTHSLSTTSECCLDHNGITDFFRFLQSVPVIKNRSVAARYNRNSRFLHRFPCKLFIPQPFNRFCLRTDKNNIALFTQCCKLCIFR